MFFQWWRQQLLELLPSRLARAGERHADTAILDVEGAIATLLVRQGDMTARRWQGPTDEAGLSALTQSLSTLEDPPSALTLRFPASSLLSKQVSLPVAARRNLKGLLGFEMDRETPFARDEVYWDFAVRREDQATGRIEVDLLIAPRAAIDPIIESVRHAGLDVDRIEVQSGTDGATAIRLGSVRHWKWLTQDRRLTALVAAAGVLSLAAIVTPFVRQQLALASADSSIESLNGQAEAAGGLRQSLDRNSGALGMVARERETNGSTLAALAAITRLLPDDSHLTALTLRGGRLTMTGVAPSAAHLIDLLVQSKSFSEPTFDSPVVQTENGGLETFTISATLIPAGGS